MIVTAKTTNTYWEITEGMTGEVKKTFHYNGETWYKLKLSDGLIKEFPAVFFWDIPDWKNKSKKG